MTIMLSFMTPGPFCTETVVGRLVQALFNRLDENGVGSCAPEDGKRMEARLALQHVHRYLRASYRWQHS